MKKLSVFIAAMSWVIAVSASTFNYKFNSEPLSKVLVLMAEEHPDLHLNFIYNYYCPLNHKAVSPTF